MTRLGLLIISLNSFVMAIYSIFGYGSYLLALLSMGPMVVYYLTKNQLVGAISKNEEVRLDPLVNGLELEFKKGAENRRLAEFVDAIENTLKEVRTTTTTDLNKGGLLDLQLVFPSLNLSSPKEQVQDSAAMEKLATIRTAALALESLVLRVQLVGVNAEIEAAHLGSLGKTFGVLASEMVKIADEYRNLVGTIRNNVEAYSRSLDQMLSQQSEEKRMQLQLIEEKWQEVSLTYSQAIGHFRSSLEQTSVELLAKVNGEQEELKKNLLMLCNRIRPDLEKNDDKGERAVPFIPKTVEVLPAKKLVKLQSSGSSREIKPVLKKHLSNPLEDKKIMENTVKDVAKQPIKIDRKMIQEDREILIQNMEKKVESSAEREPNMSHKISSVVTKKQIGGIGEASLRELSNMVIRKYGGSVDN